MRPTRQDVNAQDRLPFSSSPSKYNSPAQNKNHSSSNSQDDIFVLTCLGLSALLILSLVTQADIRVSGPILGIFFALALIYRTVKKAKAAHIEQTQSLYINNQNDLYVSASQMVDLMPIAAVLLDKRNRISHTNPLAQKLIGVENTNRPLIHYIRDPKLITHLSQALAGYTPDPFLTKIETPSKRYIRLLFSQAQSLENGSSQSLTLVIFDDVTDMQLNQKLRADFLANASHELKTPIASLMGYIETLQTHAKDDPIAREKFLNIMYGQAERMQRLISDLLSLRQIEQVAHIIPTGAGDLDTAMLAAIDSVTPMSEKRCVKIDYDNKAGNTKFNGKQDEAVQMCLNILSNAVKISPMNSTVYVTLKSLDDWHDTRAFADTALDADAYQRHIITAPPSPLPCLRLTISDSGPGFAREHIPRIGERFYRIAGDLSSGEKGTGLGLAIVKHIVKRHRGGLYVRSKPGQGTEFSIIMMRGDNAQSDHTQTDL